jgi:hypothetical protein
VSGRNKVRAYEMDPSGCLKGGEMLEELKRLLVSLKKVFMETVSKPSGPFSWPVSWIEPGTRRTWLVLFSVFGLRIACGRQQFSQLYSENPEIIFVTYQVDKLELGLRKFSVVLMLQNLYHRI